MLVGSEIEIMFDEGDIRQKVHNTLSNFGLEKYSCAVSC